MKMFLVAFDGEAPLLVERLKRLGSWARVTENAYCVKRQCKSPVDLRELLLEKGEAARMLVADMTDCQWATYKMPRPVAEWMKENIESGEAEEL